VLLGSFIILDTLTDLPAADKEHAKTKGFRVFRREVFHRSLEHILETLRPAMSKAEVVRCPDGHFRRAIYGLGPYIGDYPEQVLLTCIVQNWCPKCVMLSPRKR
jgi:Plavaka transposase